MGMTLIETGPCEAVDLIQTEDDAIAVECRAPGSRVFETDHRGHRRTRIACSAHAVDYENSPS